MGSKTKPQKKLKNRTWSDPSYPYEMSAIVRVDTIYKNNKVVIANLTILNSSKVGERFTTIKSVTFAGAGDAFRKMNLIDRGFEILIRGMREINLYQGEEQKQFNIKSVSFLNMEDVQKVHSHKKGTFSTDF